MRCPSLGMWLSCNVSVLLTSYTKHKEGSSTGRQYIYRPAELPFVLSLIAYCSCSSLYRFCPHILSGLHFQHPLNIAKTKSLAIELPGNLLFFLIRVLRLSFGNLAKCLLKCNIIILTDTFQCQINLFLRYMSLIQVLAHPLSAPLFIMKLYKMDGIPVIIQIME